ncbi:hypothetical protein MBEBAB_2853 [Brevundimonas abyssalis TAR-001]|uniref:Uncharacterized protein n=1 Tax=Brevundimonas abyssalis TAR-001 TaxID=1391729 RepID=A0A8E0NDW0_9CAUL|nr:hypothetical protein MBEBAB_2853 [Brevundimonas abyssalis TAR-001]
MCPPRTLTVRRQIGEKRPPCEGRLCLIVIADLARGAKPR